MLSVAYLVWHESVSEKILFLSLSRGSWPFAANQGHIYRVLGPQKYSLRKGCLLEGLKTRKPHVLLAQSSPSSMSIKYLTNFFLEWFHVKEESKARVGAGQAQVSSVTALTPFPVKEGREMRES